MAKALFGFFGVALVAVVLVYVPNAAFVFIQQKRENVIVPDKGVA